MGFTVQDCLAQKSTRECPYETDEQYTKSVVNVKCNFTDALITACRLRRMRLRKADNVGCRRWSRTVHAEEALVQGTKHSVAGVLTKDGRRALSEMMLGRIRFDAC